MQSCLATQTRNIVTQTIILNSKQQNINSVPSVKPIYRIVANVTEILFPFHSTNYSPKSGNRPSAGNGAFERLLDCHTLHANLIIEGRSMSTLPTPVDPTVHGTIITDRPTRRRYRPLTRPLTQLDEQGTNYCMSFRSTYRNAAWKVKLLASFGIPTPANVFVMPRPWKNYSSIISVTKCGQ